MAATIGSDPHRAAALLTAGKLVALPTETVYGLGANALDPKAVSEIFRVKNRPRFDPLIIHQYTAERLFRHVTEVPVEARLLAEACWPGPLTLVLPKAEHIPDMVTAGLSTVATRVPAHPLCREVLALLDFPVAAPSANPFGFVSPVTARHVADQLGEELEYILDGGSATVGLESTIVGFPAGVPTVFRKGGWPVEQIAEIIGAELEVKTHGSSQPQAPGMLSSHYSPGIPLRLLAHEEKYEPGKDRAVICFGPDFPVELPFYNLSHSGDLKEAARNLFTYLRAIATAGYAEVGIRLVPERGLGRAINDRLRRAAAGGQE